MIHRRTSTTITLGFDEVRGFDYDYAYDPIGNRTSATYYDEQGEAVASAYTANALNQYTSRTVPGNVQVRGEADPAAIVTVNENPTWRYPSLGGSAAPTSPRSGATSAQPQLRRKAAETSVEVGGGSASYFYGGDYADNTTLPVFHEVEIAAVVPAASPDDWDEMSAVTGRVFVAQNPEQFTYDADGNMTCDGRFRYTWNGENRLVRAQELVAPTNRNPYTVAYAYDHRGRMVKKEIRANDGNDTLVKSIAYVWDGWNIIREIVRDGGESATVTDNIWGLDLDGTLQGAGGVGGLLAVQRSDCAATNSAFCILHSVLYLPTYDANGNVSEFVSTDGSIVAHYDYSPFGETLIDSGDLASSFTHRFSTKPWCPVTGLCEYQMRKYRPKIGRWLSRDPISDNHNSDLYSFCNNTTVDNIDLLGCTSSNSNPAGDGLTWVLDVQYVPWGSSEIRNGWANTWYRWPGEPPSIRKTKEAIITKASDCCAKIESGAAYELIIHQRLPTSDSAIGIFTTLNGWQSIVQHESKRSGYILAGFATYFARIANKGNLAMKCGVICHKEGWKEARHLLEDYLSSIEFEAYSLMDNYELKAQAAIGKENGSNYKYVIQDGKKLMDGMKAYFKYPAPRLSNDDFKTMCPLSDVSKGGE